MADPTDFSDARRFSRWAACAVRKTLELLGCRSGGDFALYCLFLSGFILTIVFFRYVDVYNTHFFQTRYAAPYNAMRVVFAVYFSWLIVFFGKLFVRAVAGDRTISMLPLHERIALRFFLGTAVVTAFMLVLGYCYLFWRVVAALIAVTAIAFSYHDLVRDIECAWRVPRHSIAQIGRLYIAIRAALIAMLVVSGTLLLLVKGLYPQGGHDYYLHYFPFYMTVIDEHNIWPNDVWYQYYLSKALGPTYLAMLLADPLAPGLIAFCFAAAGALALFAMVRAICPGTLWPWVSVILYLLLNVHTIGNSLYLAHGGWGHFQKPHELSAPMMIAILWMATNIVRTTGPLRRMWWVAAAICSATVAFILMPASVILGLLFVMAWLLFLVIRRGDATAFFYLAVVAGAGLFAVLALNYLTTGAPADAGSNLLWPILDFRRLESLGTLFDMTDSAFRRVQGAHDSISLISAEALGFAVAVLKFDILRDLEIGGLLFALIWGTCHLVLGRRYSAFFQGNESANVAAFGLVLVFSIAVALFAAAAGRTESVTFVRISSFMLPVLIATVAMIFQLGCIATRLSRWGGRMLGTGVPLILTAGTLLHAYWLQRATLGPVVVNAVRFATSRYSIHDAYRDQSGWPALPDSRAIYPGMYQAWQSVGPGHRIWSFHVHSYCMVPGCRIESFRSFRISTHAADVYIGSAEQARKVLQNEGLNYFFFSTYLDFHDVLQCTPLFSPDRIVDYFGLKWTNGTDYLLTWKGPDTTALTREWVDRYRSHIRESRLAERCDDGGTPFIQYGRSVHEQAAQGKRWGLEIAQPWR